MGRMDARARASGSGGRNYRLFGGGGERRRAERKEGGGVTRRMIDGRGRRFSFHLKCKRSVAGRGKKGGKDRAADEWLIGGAEEPR